MSSNGTHHILGQRSNRIGNVLFICHTLHVPPQAARSSQESCCEVNVVPMPLFSLKHENNVFIFPSRQYGCWVVRTWTMYNAQCLWVWTARCTMYCVQFVLHVHASNEHKTLDHLSNSILYLLCYSVRRPFTIQPIRGIALAIPHPAYECANWNRQAECIGWNRQNDEWANLSALRSIAVQRCTLYIEHMLYRARVTWRCVCECHLKRFRRLSRIAYHV